MELLKYTFRHVRENSDEIYKGFGLNHLDDVTEYYVHPDNQSYKGTTTICQPIGEAVNLMTELADGMLSESHECDVYYTEDKSEFYLDIRIPDDWRNECVFPNDLSLYKTHIKDSKITVYAFKSAGELLEMSVMDNFRHFHPNYKLCACLLAVLGREIVNDIEFRSTFMQYYHERSIENFVIACEDFYQNNKEEDFEVEYETIAPIKPEQFLKLSDILKNVTPDDIKPGQGHIEIQKFADTEFSDEQKSFIPHLSSEFVLDTALENICNAITLNDVMSVLLYGPAGTGKTMSCKLICQQIQLPILETINCTENLDEYVLGKYIPVDDKIIFKESFVTKAIREGGAIVFEEINFAKPQYLAFLNSLLDDNGFVRLDNGDVVKRHKNFRFFATMNVGYFGTKELNQALYNRFNAIIEIPELSDKSIRRMLTARVPECEEVVSKILKVYHKIQKKISSEELDNVISPRNLENWARLAKYEGYEKAADKTIVPIAKTDSSLADAIRSIIKVYKWH